MKLTKRDMFAGMAMQAILSKYGCYENDRSSSGAFPKGKEDVPTVDNIAEYVYAQADAMIEFTKGCS